MTSDQHWTIGLVATAIVAAVGLTIYERRKTAALASSSGSSGSNSTSTDASNAANSGTQSASGSSSSGGGGTGDYVNQDGGTYDASNPGSGQGGDQGNSSAGNTYQGIDATSPPEDSSESGG